MCTDVMFYEKLLAVLVRVEHYAGLSILNFQLTSRQVCRTVIYIMVRMDRFLALMRVRMFVSGYLHIIKPKVHAHTSWRRCFI